MTCRDWLTFCACDFDCEKYDSKAEQERAIAAATGTAKTPKAVECEASQSGGAAASPERWIA